MLTILFSSWDKAYKPGAITWKLDNVNKVGGHNTRILGNPTVSEQEAAVYFDGVDDALVLPTIPIAGWKTFTIEVLVKPLADGPVAPRFIHFQDTAANRATFELRLTPAGNWYMDTFLKNNDTSRSNRGLTLIDSNLVHPAGQWYWVAMQYDDSTMYSFVNGHKELEGKITMKPFSVGEFSIGARLNKVAWFKGYIKEIRFHPAAIPADALQKP